VSSESLYENEGIPKDARDQAALLASKLYYYLGEYDDALSFALGAGNTFNEESHTHGSEEYVETMTCESQILFDPRVRSITFWPLSQGD